MRHRALRSLHFKLQHGLLSASVATADAAELGLEQLLAFLDPAAAGSGETADALAVAMELLVALAKQPAVASLLLCLAAAAAAAAGLH